MAGRDVVGEAFVRILPDGSAFTPALQSMLNGASKSAENAGAAIGKAMEAARPSMEAIQRATGGISEGFQNVAIAVSGVGVALKGAQLAAQKVANYLGGVFDQTTKARIGFEALLKSQEKADALLGDIIELATASPFDSGPLIQYSQQLLGVGKAANSIVPLLQSVGDVVASVGGDSQNIDGVLRALTQIQTVGRLTGQDAMQLQGQLIPITQLLSKSLGKTTAEIKKMQEQGKITADQVFQAITEQGELVAGAMNASVKTVQGSLSLLRDTVGNLQRNSPFLKALYEDAVKAIQGLASFLGSEDVTARLDALGQAALKVYEQVKPIAMAFSEVSSNAVLGGLSIAATALGAIGDAIALIPEPVLKLLVYGLLANRAAAAASAYANLAKSFVSLGSSILGSAKGQKVFTEATTASTAAIEAENAALTRSQRIRGALSKAAPIAAGAALIGGQALAGSDNTAAQYAGNALTYGAIGFQIAGPYGAAAGAAFGVATTYLNKLEAEAQAHADRMKELGAKGAANFLEANKTKWDEAGGESERFFEGEINRIKALIEEQKRLLGSTEARDSAFDTFASNLPSIGAWGSNYISGEEASRNSQVLMLEEQLKGVEEAMKALQDPANDAISKVRELLDPNSSAYNGLTGRDGIQVSLETAEFVLKKYGLTIQEVMQMTPQAVVNAINAFEGLTTATQQAAIAAKDFNDAYTAAASAAQLVYGEQQKAITSQWKAADATKAAAEAQAKAMASPTDNRARQQAEVAALAAQEAVYAQVLAETTDALHKNGDAVAAQAAADQVLIDIKNKAIFMSNQQAAAEKKNAEIMRATSEGRIAQLMRLSDVADTLENKQITINVVTTGIEQALAAIEKLKLEIALFQDPNSGINPNIASGEANEAIRQKNQREREIKLLSGTIKPTTDADKAFLDKIFGGISAGVAANDAKSADSGGSSSYDDPLSGLVEKMKSASDSLVSAFEKAQQAADDMAESLKKSIRDRVEYDKAVGTGRLIRNADRQVRDLTEVNDLATQLAARGLSESALKAVIGDLGQEDLRQLRKLNRSSDSDLQRLSTSVGTLDKKAAEIATQRLDFRNDVRQAIIEAAMSLGIKPTEEQLKVLEANFTINSSIDSQTTADDIVAALTGAKVVR